MALQHHYITKANSEALQKIYDQEAEEYIDPKILEDEDSEEEYERTQEVPNQNPQISKKPKPEEFGPMPKPMKPQKKTFKEKFRSFF